MYLGEADREDEWQIQNDFETLIRAGEISKDDKRLKKVQAFAKKQKEQLENVMDDDYLKSIGINRD